LAVMAGPSRERLGLRVVCVSDTHGFFPSSLPPGDVLIHAGLGERERERTNGSNVCFLSGDYCRAKKERDLDDFERWIANQPHKV
jgi:hypothetical protein